MSKTTNRPTMVARYKGTTIVDEWTQMWQNLTNISNDNWNRVEDNRRMAGSQYQYTVYHNPYMYFETFLTLPNFLVIKPSKMFTFKRKNMEYKSTCFEKKMTHILHTLKTDI